MFSAVAPAGPGEGGIFTRLPGPVHVGGDRNEGMSRLPLTCTLWPLDGWPSVKNAFRLGWRPHPSAAAGSRGGRTAPECDQPPHLGDGEPLPGGELVEPAVLEVMSHGRQSGRPMSLQYLGHTLAALRSRSPEGRDRRPSLAGVLSRQGEAAVQSSNVAAQSLLSRRRGAWCSRKNATDQSLASPGSFDSRCPVAPLSVR
jgi:hypothetical protein